MQRTVILVFSPTGEGCRIGFNDACGVILMTIDDEGQGSGELIMNALLGVDEEGHIEVRQRLAPLQLLAEVERIR